MFKALLFELLSPHIRKEKPSCTNISLYFFTIIGLVLLIAANYFYLYSEPNREIALLMV